MSTQGTPKDYRRAFDTRATAWTWKPHNVVIVMMPIVGVLMAFGVGVLWIYDWNSQNDRVINPIETARSAYAIPRTDILPPGSPSTSSHSPTSPTNASHITGSSTHATTLTPSKNSGPKTLRTAEVGDCINFEENTVDQNPSPLLVIDCREPSKVKITARYDRTTDTLLCGQPPTYVEDKEGIDEDFVLCLAPT